ncbi:hypothetical protein [Chitinophaga rhizophila]|uniref:DUF1735 domain-containing protein n=1 Tax=Chitinophaga rhizophila TaxID=2866212 RepID=A0ABS7GJH9_9BACT|nr:hypothetical protein [Chitinophaga rhizophila]MBW8687375.1 hypothetical protein [Chitinophaga rhizophila]
MNIFRSARNLLLLSFVAFLFAACGKEDPIVDMGYLPPATLPDSVTMSYGTILTLTLPDEYKNRPYVHFRLDFKANTNLKVNNTDSLQALLAKAITVDAANSRIRIDGSKLYPNNNSSDASGLRLPDVYYVSLIAESTVGLKAVRSDVKLKVLPAALGIKELSATDPIPYGYSLYSDNKDIIYTVDYNGLSQAGTVLTYHQNGRPDSRISLQGDKIVLDKDAGDELKKHEWTYDLFAILTKDGYTVATKQFRAVLMPKPKFLYGTYYPEYDLTIVQNSVVIALWNGYTSPAPVLNPEKYKGSFRILSISKGGTPYNDSYDIFSVDKTTGKISVAENSILDAGEYKLVVEATTTVGITLTADFTLVME